MTNPVFNLQNLHAVFETELDRYLPKENELPNRLHQAMRYMMLGKAKRVRPLLIYATAACFGLPYHKAHVTAVAVECLHTYSLIHDDLPAMDNDALRRGQPTCHKAFDEATAILAGDALLNFSFELLSAPNPEFTAATQLQLLAVLSQATGSRGMIGGQMLDIQSEGKTLAPTEIETMQALKTGRLIRASVMMGAILADCNEKQKAILQQFADTMGIAFQIKDDVLDVEGSSQTLGKNVGRDHVRQKASALNTTQLTQAKTRLEGLQQYALELLNCFPENMTPLQEMVHYIIQRES